MGTEFCDLALSPLEAWLEIRLQKIQDLEREQS